MPPGGAEARAEQLATLARVRHERLIAEEVGELIAAAAAETRELPYDSDEASLVRAARRDWEKARRVPADLRAEMTRAASIGERAWVTAREESDFAAFLPHLELNIALRRRYSECFEPEHPYDPLLDDFEPEMTTEEMAAVLAALRDGLEPLLAAVRESAAAVDDRCLHGSFDSDRQAALARRIAGALPLEAGEWRLDETVHPFATAISPRDIRVTTRYEEDHVGASVWAVIHEAGHGMYENGIPARLARTPLGHGASLGFHESQSRLWENWVGRSRPYIERLHPLLLEAFPEHFAGVDPETVYRAANKVTPSLIRVEADELTYNLHVILRFELELAIFDGALEPAELADAWRERTRELLGIEVPDDARGVLQDVHWSAGSFGYFPTYSLGNVIAGQLWELAESELGPLDDRIASGELTVVRDWLRARLYDHGAKFTPKELIERVTGGPFDVGPYIRRLAARTSELYGAGASA